MKPEQSPASAPLGIGYSPYESRQVAGEQCVAAHGLTYLLAGSLRVTKADEGRVFGAGSLPFVRKNRPQLARHRHHGYC